MRRLLFFILTAAIIFIPIAASAAGSPKPLVLVFASPVGEKAVPTDPEIASVVIGQLRAMGKLEVLAFNPDLPAINRAVLERRLRQDVVNQISDPKKAVQVANALHAQYALFISGSIVDKKVGVTLELLKLPGGGRWESSMGSVIAEGGGPLAAANRSNAIFTAAGSAVSQVAILAFGQAAAVNIGIPAIVTPASPTEIPAAPEEPAIPRDTAAEYTQLLKQADAYEAKRDLPNAIEGLRHAINLKPDEPAPRLKLAQIYSDQGMTAEAVDECKRALLFRSNDLSIYNMLAKLYMANGAIEEAAAQCREIVRLDPQNVEARLTLADLYWNQSKIDDAMSTYQEIVKLAPENPAPHVRLQKLCAAKKMYTPALEHLLYARLLAAGTQLDELGRYKVIAQVILEEFNTVLDGIKAAGTGFKNGDISREDYYQECKDAVSRIDALASFVSIQTSPSDFKEAHSHGVLGVSLLAQASGYMVSYLETEKQYYIEQARQLQSEAETEMNLFSRAVLKT